MRPKHLLILILFKLALLQKAYSQNNPAKTRTFYEKVYLHLDREMYFAGEDVWYKAYLLNAQVNQLLNTSNNLYVELIAANAKIVDRKVIRLEDGIGNGDFKLSDSLPKGTYRIRAYTNWMKNFGDKFVFDKEIEISNTLSASSKASSKISGQQAALQTAGNEKKGIRFFPEGGSMVENVAGIVAFKAEDNKAKGVKVKGAIISSTGDTITSFVSNESGMGLFVFTPVAGTKYVAKGHFEDKTPFSTALPSALQKGFVLRATSSDSLIKVIVSTNEATLSEYKGKQMQLKLRHGGVPYSAVSFVLNGLQSAASYIKADYPSGIAAITLSDDANREHCERLVFIDPKKVVKVNVLTNKAIYKSKERVVVNVKTVDAQNKPVKADMSLSVVDASLVPVGKGNIVSYFNLESELRGDIDRPEQYFDSATPDRAKKLDILLMTQGWRDFVWKRMRDTSFSISNLNETGFTISGKVTEKKSDKPLAGVNVSLFANGAKGSKLFGTKTNANGIYFFDNINLEGNQVIKLVSSDMEGKKTGKIMLDSLYTKPLEVKPLSEIDENAFLATFSKEAANRKEQLKKFSLSDTIAIKEVAVRREKQVRTFDDVLTSFGYPDQNFVITAKDHDYNSLSHYLLTNVNGAMPSDDPTSDGVVFMADGKKVRPTIFVDKREDLFQRMDYFSLRMDLIEKITVRHMMGMMETDSLGNRNVSGKSNHVYLIYLTLKPGAFDRKELSLLNANVNGYYSQRTFYSPIYNSVNPGSKVDVRTTIYWHPNIKTDENGSATVYFNNADPKTKVRIVAEGVTLDGLPISGSGGYEIK